MVGGCGGGGRRRALSRVAGRPPATSGGQATPKQGGGFCACRSLRRRCSAWGRPGGQPEHIAPATRPTAPRPPTPPQHSAPRPPAPVHTQQPTHPLIGRLDLVVAVAAPEGLPAARRDEQAASAVVLAAVRAEPAGPQQGQLVLGEGGGGTSAA